MLKILRKYEALIAHLFTITGLVFVWLQLHQSNEHKKWENYNAMNLRYYEWYANMPDKMDVDTCVPFSKQPQEVKRWARTYFNLYSEEYWLYQEDLIPKEMWTKRIDNGVNVNLETYPLLVRGYAYWKSKNAFVHPDGFRSHIARKLEMLKGELKLKKCEIKSVTTSTKRKSNKKTESEQK
ncbi:MAG: hypothetical protein GC149_13380 [Gammaproteobacteria bacterium]|nr:hypothetical protein [Gammaproteobacteria bacterium]